MNDVRIQVMKMAKYDDLIKEYENQIEHACDLHLGDTFVSRNAERPAGFCTSAWGTIAPFVTELAHGGGNFFDGWMQNPKSAMLSCNDGFRPVSFLIEVLE